MFPGQPKQTDPPLRAHQRLISCCCGDGELSLISRCRDRVRPWFPQHPVSIITPGGLAQKQPQQPSVGHHLYRTSAAAAAPPSASSRAQVRADGVSQAGANTFFQLSACGARSGVVRLSRPVAGEVAGWIRRRVVFQGTAVV